ncbi:hypothetical protein O4H49_01960 [Kiloniella laminariae]|uniref:Polysaccharide biosynthesis protein C-terminal domain-containing protein n=1 Tax=Kiloniella laminariae TaxID=454162 RepID=A0ABT4LEI9_9PROT|nr:hypothetical protein [Kiloniella laminariae]MCZ4279523.1 hypothetical protein [Kiloniella laminariae]
MTVLSNKFHLLRNLVFLTGSMVLLRVLSATTTIVLTHWLVVEDYGRFSYGQSLALLLMFGVSVGLPTYIVKELAGKNETAGALLKACLRLITGLALVEWLVLAGIFLTGVLPDGLAGTVLPMAVGGAALAGNMIFQGFFRAFDRFALQSALLVLQGVAMLVILLSAARAFNSSEAVAWAFAGTAGGIFLLHGFFAFRLTGGARQSNPEVLVLLKRTLPFGMIDWIMAGYPLVVGTGLLFSAGEAEVGVFYAGFAVFSAVAITALVLDQVFVREIMRSGATQQTRITLLYILAALAAGLVVGGVLFLSSGLLASLFFGGEQPELVMVLKMLSLAVAFRFVSLASSSIERLNGAQNKVLFFHTCGLFLLILCIPFALQWGLLGGTASVVVLEGCLAILFLLRRRKLFRVFPQGEKRLTEEGVRRL